MSLLKTFWEKEKMLVTSNFSFSHNVFISVLFSEVFKRQDCVVKSERKIPLFKPHLICTLHILSICASFCIHKGLNVNIGTKKMRNKQDFTNLPHKKGTISKVYELLIGSQGVLKTRLIPSYIVIHSAEYITCQ